MLAGRDALTERFSGASTRVARGRSGTSILLFGPHGVGKTVLLNRVGDIAERGGLRVGWVEVPQDGDLARVVAARLRASDASDADDLTDVLVAAGRAAADRSSGIVLLVDELQQLSPHDLAALMTAIERTVQLDLPVVLVGAGLPQLPLLVADAKPSARQVLELVQLGALDPDDTREALRQPVRERGIKLRRRALDRLVELTGGYPCVVQAWGYELWNAAAGDGASIGLGDVERAAPAAWRRLEQSLLHANLDRLTAAEQEYLRAMAALGPGPHRSGEIAEQLGVRVERVGPRRARLIQKGMIYSPGHGETAFAVPLLDDLLRRAVSPASA